MITWYRYSLIVLPFALANENPPTSQVQTVYATNPRFEYRPSISCAASGPFGGCKLYDPWEMGKYAVSGKFDLVMRTSSWGNDPSLPDKLRKVNFGFRGTSISIYGAPKSTLDHPPGRQQVCLDYQCAELGVAEIYDNVSPDRNHEPVRLWTASSLNENRYHRLELQLLDGPSGDTTGMTLHHVDTEESIVQSSPYTLGPNEEFVNATYHDTHPMVSYSPQRTAGGGRDFNPWNLNVYTGNHGQNASYHHTSNWAHSTDEKQLRGVSFIFKGTHISIYGAPYRTTNENHAKQEVCIDRVCNAVDVVRAYINIPDEEAGMPVLLWATQNLDPAHEHHVRIRLLDFDSPLGVMKYMTFSKVVVTEVRKKRPFSPPNPGMNYHDVTVHHSNPLVVYSPRKTLIGYDPWDVEIFLGPSGTNESYTRTSTWQNMALGPKNRNLALLFDGIRIKLYGAPRNRVIHPHGKQEVCVDEVVCTLIDVDRAYLNIDPDIEHLPVLVWSSDDYPSPLIRNGTHQLVLKLVEAAEDDAFGVIRGLTFSHAVYTWEEEIPGPSRSTTSTKVSTIPPVKKTILTTETVTSSITATETEHVTLTRTTTATTTATALPTEIPQLPEPHTSESLNTTLMTVILFMLAILGAIARFIHPNITAVPSSGGEGQPLLSDGSPSPAASPLQSPGWRFLPLSNESLPHVPFTRSPPVPPPYRSLYGTVSPTTQHRTVQQPSNQVQISTMATTHFPGARITPESPGQDSAYNIVRIGPQRNAPGVDPSPLPPQIRPAQPSSSAQVDGVVPAPGNPATRGRHRRRRGGQHRARGN